MERGLFAIRLSKEERALLKEAAVIRKLPLSAFIRAAALAVAGVDQAEVELERAKRARRQTYEDAWEPPAEPPEEEPRSSRTWGSFREYANRGGFTPGADTAAIAARAEMCLANQASARSST
jgi:uncharacterized protein (DUF1778 family)